LFMHVRLIHIPIRETISGVRAFCGDPNTSNSRFSCYSSDFPRVENRGRSSPCCLPCPVEPRKSSPDRSSFGSHDSPIRAPTARPERQGSTPQKEVEPHGPPKTSHRTPIDKAKPTGPQPRRRPREPSRGRKTKKTAPCLPLVQLYRFSGDGDWGRRVGPLPRIIRPTFHAVSPLFLSTSALGFFT